MAVKTSADTNGRVKIKIPRGNAKDEQDVFVGINGVNYIVPKGKEVSVPDFVAQEIERSQAAQERFFETQGRLTAKE